MSEVPMTTLYGYWKDTDAYYFESKDGKVTAMLTFQNFERALTHYEVEPIDEFGEELFYGKLALAWLFCQMERDLNTVAEGIQRSVYVVSPFLAIHNEWYQEQEEINKV